ncbi:EMB1789 [Symbiodinium necroappetens]|uniref:EMB1789 protein n=1 Tax=Symbiodinium necroappetens TaxID=1628268 RepID=A0A812SEP3_9DINO|nr:EMB1789 [Symbiodinium necroappetens]
MTKAEQKKAVQFTRMCKFWQTNECKMGADCTFAHDASDLRPSPKPCFDFAKKGVCTRGDACRFVHQLGPKAKVNVTEMHNATFQMIRPDIPSQLLAAYTMPMQSLDAPGKFALNSGAAPWFPWESDAVLNQFPQAPPGLDQIPLPKSLIGGAVCMVDNNNKDEADVCSTSSGDSSLGLEQFPVRGMKSTAADEMMFATGSLTSTMSLSATPSQFREVYGVENYVCLSV